MFEFNFVTFIAVIINFLIIYIVFRLFFYKPVKNVIDNRDKSIKEEFNKNKSLLDEAEKKFKEAEDKFIEAENRAKTIIKEAEEVSEKMIQEKTEEAKKQAKEIILSAEEQSKSSVEAANVQLKNLSLKIAGNLSSQILSSIITPEMDYEIVASFINELDNVKILDETGKKLINLREVLLSDTFLEQGLIIDTAHELTADLKKELENKILSIAGKQVKINYEVDKNICGGFKLKIGFYEVDLSMNGQIKNLIKQIS
jgi:F-type H+-transporting ATPase subunit b